MEFPPHISGGLGTACFGLTQSLGKQKVKVAFVVPRLFGDERKDITLINASLIRNGNGNRKLTFQETSLHNSVQLETHSPSAFEPEADKFIFIQVPSTLSPYEPSETSLTRHSKGLRSWNYTGISKATSPAFEDHEALSRSAGSGHDKDDDDFFQFSGTYGNNLIEEVKRYAKVASVIAQECSFDVIHAHDWMTFPAGILAKRKSKKPLVVHVHSTEIDRAGDQINERVFELEKYGFSQANKIISVSNRTKEILMSRYNIPRNKITVVHNGILPKSKTQTFTFPDIASHFVTFLGRVTRQKGPGYFVEAAHKVLTEFPYVHFIVAGAGDLLPQIIERVAQLNMSSKFHFTGFLTGNQVDQIWSLTDVYVMPSVSEPFGIAPLEAIQGDVPVILSKQSGVSEVMPHAIKIDFWDVKALAAAICSVLRYESLSQALRTNGKQHIQHLTWDKAATAVKAIYHELTGQE